ncbi:prenyltransferase/squalene oxidase repeat-containing protein [Rubritalea tangerina]|uniref:Prenyltransferase/squalene oxidase repeat-containing protein n=1 Tax=Rubritalea tangerina TaxID=430798 RepID=A0ABW4ZFD3_9BACT
MSLHAQLSPTAKAALAAQRRNSTISSLIIAILSLFLIGLILFIIALTIEVKNPPPTISYSPGLAEKDDIEQPETPNQVERKPSSPSSSMAKVIASTSASPTAVPVPDIEITEPSLDFGNGDDFGDGWDDGDGNGPGGSSYGSIPDSMKKRCSKADRLARLKKEGGTPECEDAVVKALQFLQKTQNNDGSWQKKHRVGYTGLALLAYLGHCETPASPEFGATVEKAIVYLVNVGMANNGKLATDMNDKHWPYEHGIATYALAEAYTLCSKQNLNLPNLDEVVSMAGQQIITSQHQRTGGWDYNYDYSGQRGGDSSIVCWQLQALKACKYTGIEGFEKLTTVSRKGLEYLESCQAADGGVRYQPNNGKPTMTGGSILCHQQWGKGSRATVRAGRKFIEKKVTFGYDTAESDLYAHYYYGQAMMNIGGTTWRNYNKLFRDEVLAAQNPDGSFKSPGGGNAINGTATSFAGGGSAALHYRTCLATLMLEVYYRFLPASSSR